MKRNNVALGLVFAIGLLSVITEAAGATCWTCAFDPGVGTFYCASTSGEGAANCIPIPGDYCDLIGSANCNGSDHCQCYRYPAIVTGKRSRPLARVTVGVSLFRGRTEADQARLESALPETPQTITMRGEYPTATACATAVELLSKDESALSVDLCGYMAVTERGQATARLLGHDHTGVLADAHPSGANTSLRLLSLVKPSTASGTSRLDMARNSAAVCRVSVLGKTYACVVWSLVISDNSENAVAAAAAHRTFVESADSFQHRRIAELEADSPDLTTLGVYGDALPARWGTLAVRYR